MIRCKEEIIFPNELSMQEHITFLHDLIYDMINDLGIITGVDEEVLFEDYKFRNGTNLVKDVLKSKGRYRQWRKRCFKNGKRGE